MKRTLLILVSYLMLSLPSAQSKDLHDLAVMLGEPKNNVDAIAQNTVMVIYLSSSCGYGKRGERYKQDNDSEIQILLGSSGIRVDESNGKYGLNPYGYWVFEVS